MKELLAWVKTRMGTRSDSEHEQAIVRIVIAVGIAIYLLLFVVDDFRTLSNYWREFSIIGAEAIAAIGLFVWVLAKPAASYLRRVLGMVADYTTLGVLMHIQGEMLAPFYVLILWVTLGNGLRFGNRHLYTAMAMAVTSFLLVIKTTPFWLENYHAAYGLLFGLIAIPGYISTLIRALHHARDEALKASNAKSRFLANMSHEFRTPLNGIIGVADLLFATELKGHQREYAQVIQTSARTMLMLVEDVLDISVIESGKLQRHDVDFDLKECIDRIRLMIEPQARAKGITFQISDLPKIKGKIRTDYAHLTQILLNLTANAVKFTEKGSVDTIVELLDKELQGPWLRFTVRDSGIGIAKDQLEKLFEAFERSDNAWTRRHGGTGLGTTIAKLLTRLLGGTIGVNSQLGVGSEFWIEIPIAIIPEERNANDDQQKVDNDNVVAFDDPFRKHRLRIPKMSLLIADDQPANRLVLSRMLSAAGHDVIDVNSGEEALDLLAERRFDALLIDLHMPDVSGIDAIKQLRVMQAGKKKTPVVVVSADATREAQESAMESGAFAYLTKPISAERLLRVVTEVSQIDGIFDKDERDHQPEVSSQTVDSTETEFEVLSELIALSFDRQFVTEFVEQTVRDANQQKNELNMAGQRRDWTEVREAAHALKGLSQNLGAMILADLCRDIMNRSSHELEQQWPQTLMQVDQLLIDGISKARKYIDAQSTTSDNAIRQ